MFILLQSSNWFSITVLHHWLKNLRHFIQWTIKPKPIYYIWLTRTCFSCFASASINYFEFWLVYCTVCVLCDWLGWSLLFWFYAETCSARYMYHCSQITTLQGPCFWIVTHKELRYSNSTRGWGSNVSVKSKLQHPLPPPPAFEFLENFCSNFHLTRPRSCSNALALGKITRLDYCFNFSVASTMLLKLCM